jgi:hypothetical protein
VSTQRDIYKLDILDAICEMEQTDHARLNRARSWLNANTDFLVSDSDIAAYLDSLLPQKSVSLSDIRQPHESIQSEVMRTPLELPSAKIPAQPLAPSFTALFILRMRTLPYLKILLLTCSIFLLARFSQPIADLEMRAENQVTPSYAAELITPMAPHMRIIQKIKMKNHLVIAITYKNIPNPYQPIQPPYTYKPIDYIALRNYLKLERNSYLVNDAFLNEIIILSKLNNIDPLLLLAIIGQEQGFVPETSSAKHMIVNNPYNVHSSWQRYNTTLADTTLIAIELIQERLLTKPENTDAFEWLNTVYAEDPNWSNGVSTLYETLSQYGRAAVSFSN